MSTRSDIIASTTDIKPKTNDLLRQVRPKGIMLTLVPIFLLACVLAPAAYAEFPLAAPNSQNLANLFFRSRLMSQDPAVAMACFSDYIVKGSEVSEIYGRDYNQCLLDAKAGRKAIEEEMVDKRVTIGESSRNICKRLTTCDGLNTTLEVFDCHSKIGSNNTKLVYSLSGNASEYASIMQEKYRNIDLNHEKCCKTAERLYVEATAANYRTLQDCLDGRVKPNPPIITTTTTTTAAPTTSSTTTTTTTIASTTEVDTTPELPIPSSTESIVEATQNANRTINFPGSQELARLLKLFK